MLIKGDPRLEQLKHLKPVQVKIREKPPVDDFLLEIGSTYRKPPPNISDKSEEK